MVNIYFYHFIKSTKLFYLNIITLFYIKYYILSKLPTLFN